MSETRANKKPGARPGFLTTSSGPRLFLLLLILHHDLNTHSGSGNGNDNTRYKNGDRNQQLDRHLDYLLKTNLPGFPGRHTPQYATKLI